MLDAHKYMPEPTKNSNHIRWLKAGCTAYTSDNDEEDSEPKSRATAEAMSPPGTSKDGADAAARASW